MKYSIKTNSEMGRGLYASNYEGPIKKDEVILQNELIVLDSLDSVLLDSTALKYYTFKYKHNQSCIALGDGTLLNHSINPNVGYILHDLNHDVHDRKVITFYALRDIEQGEQLFIDYGADGTINIGEYIRRPSLY